MFSRNSNFIEDLLKKSQGFKILEVGVGPKFYSRSFYCLHEINVVGIDRLPPDVAYPNFLKVDISHTDSVATLGSFDIVLASKLFNRNSEDSVMNMLNNIASLRPRILIFEEYQQDNNLPSFVTVDGLMKISTRLFQNPKFTVFRNQSIFHEKYYEARASFPHRIRAIFKTKRDTLIIWL